MASIRLLGEKRDRVEIAADFDGISAETLFDHFTQADLITQWWPQSAEIDARTGGNYNLIWPSAGFHLAGRFTTFERPTSLSYTWLWKHIPAAVERHVTITFSNGTVHITHGSYGTGAAEQAARQSHVDGWQHFLKQLQLLFEQPSSQPNK